MNFDAAQDVIAVHEVTTAATQEFSHIWAPVLANHFIIVFLHPAVQYLHQPSPASSVLSLWSLNQ
jgi:hypothetical protein